jgi:hypothetical protein
MPKSGLLYYTEYKSPNIPEEKKKERIRGAKPREKKIEREGLSTGPPGRRGTCQALLPLQKKREGIQSQIKMRPV